MRVTGRATGASLGCQAGGSPQPAPGLGARGRADSLAHPGQFRGGSGALAGHSYLLSGVGSPTFFPLVQGGVQAREPRGGGGGRQAKPAGARGGVCGGGGGGEAGSTRRALPRARRPAGAGGARRGGAPGGGVSRAAAGRGRPGAEPESG